MIADCLPALRSIFLSLFPENFSFAAFLASGAFAVHGASHRSGGSRSSGGGKNGGGSKRSAGSGKSWEVRDAGWKGIVELEEDVDIDIKNETGGGEEKGARHKVKELINGMKMGDFSLLFEVANAAGIRYRRSRSGLVACHLHIRNLCIIDIAYAESGPL
jgi:hypothetical protein